MGVQKIVYKMSTGLTVLLFGFTGVMKITPVLNPSMYDELKHEFGHFVRLPPVDMFHLQATTYMLIVGIIEVTCAGLIVLGDYHLRKLATWALLVVMLGALYTHYVAGHPPPQFVPAVVALSLVLTRLYTMGALQQVEVKVKI